MRIQSVLRKHRGELLRLDNVTSVGISQKNGKGVIVVFVKRGLPQVAARSVGTIPQMLDGYEVDIHEEIRVGQ